MLGTFALSLAVIVFSSGSAAVLTPYFAALALGLFVYTVGGLSGAYLNPAITIGAWSIKKIDARDAIAYIVAQFVGGAIALLVASFLIADLSSRLAPMKYRLMNNPMIGLAEALGAFFLAFGVASVLHGKTPRDASGAVVGGSLLLGIFMASTLSNGILNPAVALAVGSFNLMYLAGPIVGAIAGMWAYTSINN